MSFRASPEPRARGERHLYLRYAAQLQAQVGIPEVPHQKATRGRDCCPTNVIPEG